MDRRTFMAATATLPLAGAVEAAQPQPGATVDALVVDPHPEWLKQWKAAEKAWIAAEEETPEDKALGEEYERLSLLLCQTPAATAQGVAAQFEWFKEDLGYYVTEMVGDDYSGVLDTMLAGVKQLAGAA